MGEANRKKQTRAALVAGRPCIYCGKPATSVEHMPPLSMFDGRRRPKGMEFPACDDCNSGTSTADLVAGFMARLDMDTPDEVWQSDEYLGRLRTIRKRAPGVVDELVGPQRAKPVLYTSPGGVLQRAVQINADGPIVQACLTVFTAKVAMALYAEVMGERLPDEGGAMTWFYLNAGLQQATAEKLLRLMPGGGTLKQGAFSVPDQFYYRHNFSMEHRVMMALMSFHRGLHVFTLTSAEPGRWGMPAHEVPHGHFVRPGELYSRMPQRIPSAKRAKS